MLIEKIKVGVSRLVNIGNYENVLIHVEAIGKVSLPQANEQDVYKELSDFCKYSVNEEVTKIKAKMERLETSKSKK